MRQNLAVGRARTIGLTTAGVAAGREEAVRAWSSSSGEISTEIAAKALVLGLLRRADHRGTDVRIDLQLPFRSDAWPRTPICPQRWHWRVVLIFSWKGQMQTLMNWSFGPPVHTAPRFGQIHRQHWNAFRCACRQFSRPQNRGQRPQLQPSSEFYLRRLNAHLLASGFYVFFGYVASDANPADEPSRCHEPK